MRRAIFWLPAHGLASARTRALTRVLTCAFAVACAVVLVCALAAPALLSASAPVRQALADESGALAASGGKGPASPLAGWDDEPLPMGVSVESAVSVSITRLAGADESLDSSLVIFRGEAVGEPVNSSLPGYKWVLMQSHSSETTESIEVLMSDSHVAAIENFGSYDRKGSTLAVVGIYRVSDPAQMGAVDVTAYGVHVVDPGGPVEHPVDMNRLWVGVVLAVVGFGLMGLNFYLKRRSRA